MSPTFTSDDVGTPVETADGDVIGVVTDVDPETAYVEPASDAGDSTRAVLDWGDAEAVPIADDAVAERTDDAIRLEAEFAADAVTSASTAESEEGDEDAGEAAADHDPGEPVAANATEAGPDDPGATPDGDDGEIGAPEAAEPMVEDDEFYDTPEGGARVDPDETMEPPAETESEDSSDRIEGSTTDESESDREDVDVDPDDVTAGEPEAEIDDDEDVGRRRGPDD